MDGRGGRETWRRARELVMLAVAPVGAGLGTALVQIATSRPRGLWNWTLLWLGVALVAFTSTTAGPTLFGVFLRGFGGALRNVGRRLRAGLLAVLVVLPVLLGGWCVARVFVPLGRVWLLGCPQPVALSVLTSPETVEVFRQVADSYEQWTAKRNHNCRTVDLYVYDAPSAMARDALADGWTSSRLGDTPSEPGSNYLRMMGPRPAIWLPESTLEIDQVRALMGDHDLVHLRDGRPIALSPLVLGVPKPAASRFRDNQDTWKGLFEQTTRLGMKLVRPDPNTSVTGQLFTTALYEETSTTTQRHAIEQQIADALDTGGYLIGSTSDSTALLCRQRQRKDAANTAVVVPEWALYQYNHEGGVLGKKCAIDWSGPASYLSPIYPRIPARGYLNYPFVRLEWKKSPDEGIRASAADAFGAWLRSEDGQTALQAVGLQAPVFSPTQPTWKHVANDVLPQYQQARRPTQVLLALDASGSMNARVGPGSDTRFDVAREGVKKSRELMGTRDEFGLWIFPGPGGQAHRELLPVGRAPASQLAQALDLKDLRGETPLFRTLRDGVRYLADRAKGDTTAVLVVLTDGENTAGDSSVSNLISEISDKKVRVFVVAVGEANCAARALSAVTSNTGGDCRNADVSSVHDVLGELFEGLWGGTHGVG